MTTLASCKEMMFSELAELIHPISMEALERFCKLRGEELVRLRYQLSHMFSVTDEEVCEQRLLDTIPEYPSTESNHINTPNIAFGEQWLLDHPDFDFDNPFGREKIDRGVLEDNPLVMRGLKLRAKYSGLNRDTLCPFSQR